MIKNNLLPLSQEGLKTIIITIMVFLILTALDLDFFSFLVFTLIVFLAYIYRNPEREIVVFEAKSIVSPVDGIVTSIEEINDENFAYKISIDSNYFNVGVLRAPFNASLKFLEIRKGAKLAANTTLANKLNENTTLIFEDESSNLVKVKHQTKDSLANISINTIENQNLLQTKRYGFMTNGTTTIYLPHNFRVSVDVGNEICATETLIGYFS